MDVVMKHWNSNFGFTGMNSNFIFYILIVLLATYHSLQADTQLPELIVIQGDTLEMTSLPISSFIRFYKFRGMPGKFRAKYNGTNCWRGYQGLWELLNDSLYLREIFRCNVQYFNVDDECIMGLKRYGLPDTIARRLMSLRGVEYDGMDALNKGIKKILGKKLYGQYSGLITGICNNSTRSDKKLSFSKEQLVKKMYRRNNYFAEEFTGKLRIRTGKRISNYQMGFGTVYEQDLVIGISKGVAKNRIRVNTIYYLPNCENSQHFCERDIDFCLPKSYSKTDCDFPLSALTDGLPREDARSYRTYYRDSLQKTNISCITWRSSSAQDTCDSYSLCANYANAVIGRLGNAGRVDSLRYFKIFNKPDDGCSAYGCLMSSYKNGQGYGLVVLMNCDFRAVLVVQSDVLDKMGLSELQDRLLSGVSLHRLK
jgi:hypothetical protein